MTFEPLVADRIELPAVQLSAVGRILLSAPEADTFHPLWTGKHASHGKVRVEAGAAGPATLRSRAHLSSVQLAFGGLAVARVDDWAERWTALHLLFLIKGRWRLAGAATATAAAEQGEDRFGPTNAEREILDVLAAYYSAVRDGDPGVIKRIFSPTWEMKNHEGADLVREDKPTFVARIAAGPLPGYDDDRRISDVQVIHGVLAYVRVDRPSRPSTTVFLFMREAGAWRIIDKAWIDGRA